VSHSVMWHLGALINAQFQWLNI